MRKIEKLMIQAVNNKQNFKLNNTAVKVIAGGVFVLLHGNIIFARINGRDFYSNAGWNTSTTSSRLRALGANYSTNYKKCKCDLLSKKDMLNIYYKNMFGLC